MKANKNVAWETLSEGNTVQNLKKLCSERRNFLAQFDIILVLTGSEDMKNGLNGKDIYDDVMEQMRPFAERSAVYISQLPPIALANIRRERAVYNYKLQTLNDDKIKMVNTDKAARGKRVMGNDGITLSDEGVDVFATFIRNEITIPPPESRGHRIYEPEPQDESKRTEFVEIDGKNIGAVIGKGGANIREITETHGVNIAIGKWVDKRKEAGTNDRQGALVEGKPNAIRAAKRKIDEIAESNEKKMKK